jgi:hypothetical protein
MTIPTKIVELAKQAGFVFWSDETWGPGPSNIDWNCDYSTEFNTFVQLLINECSHVANNRYEKGFAPVGNYIKDYFATK